VHARLHRVLVLLRPERVGRGLLDELQRELHLRVLRLRVLDRHLVRGAHLVRVVELLHHQPAVARADEDEVLLAPRGVAREGGLPGALEREREEPVSLAAALARSEVVGAIEVDRIHLSGGHELGDVDGLGGELV
jgi:hypothetical protein